MSIRLERILSNLEKLQISQNSLDVVKASCDQAAELHSAKTNGRLIPRPSSSEKLDEAIVSVLASGLGSFIVRKRIKNLIREIYLTGDFDLFLESCEAQPVRNTE